MGFHTNYLLKCPHCGAVIWYSRDQEPPKALGNTQQVCEKCHKQYLSNMYYEWENLTKEEKRYVLFSQNYWDFGIVEGLEVFTEEKLRKIVKKNWSLLGGLTGANRKNKELLDSFLEYKDVDMSIIEKSKVIQDSIKRTSDPEYRRVLLDIGREFYGTDY